MGKKHIQTLMEITKWPPAFRKYDAFKARILACKVKYKANKFRQSKQRDRREKQSQHLGQSHLPKKSDPTENQEKKHNQTKMVLHCKNMYGQMEPKGTQLLKPHTKQISSSKNLRNQSSSSCMNYPWSTWVGVWESPSFATYN